MNDRPEAANLGRKRLRGFGGFNPWSFPRWMYSSVEGGLVSARSCGFDIFFLAKRKGGLD